MHIMHTHSCCPLTVYLRSSPEVCYHRLLQRGRAEEKPVTLVGATYYITAADVSMKHYHFIVIPFVGVSTIPS